MLETTIGIDFNVKGDKLRKDSEQAAQSFAKRIESSLKNTVRALGLDKFSPVAAGGGKEGGGGTTATGVALGLIAGGVMGLMNLLADIPIISAVMKMFKSVLMLLFMPLIPILKPIMVAFGLFMKILQPVMMGLMKGIEKIMSGDIFGGLKDIGTLLAGVAADILKWAGGVLWKGIISVFDALKGIGKWLWDNTIVPAFNALLGVGKWIWDNIISPAFKFLDKVGSWIWNLIVAGLKDVANFGTWIWDKFVDGLKVVGSFGTWIWTNIKDTWTWGLDLASKLWAWIKTQLGNVFGGGKTTTKEGGGDFVITPTGQHIKTDPADYIFATKNPQNMAGGTSKSINLTLNIRGNQFRDRSDIDYMKREITSMIRSEMRAAGR